MTPPEPITCPCGDTPTQVIVVAGINRYLYRCEPCGGAAKLYAVLKGQPYLSQPLGVCETCQKAPATVFREGLCHRCDFEEQTLVLVLEALEAA